MDANDTEHIWLRQTITYTDGGQTRTVEIGIPVPRNATAQEIEALLGVADAGMSALSRRLDAHIAGTPGATVLPPPSSEVGEIEQVAPASALPAASAPPASANGHAPEAPEAPEVPDTPETPEAPEAPASHQPVSRPSEASAPAPARPASAASAPAAPSQPSRPAPPSQRPSAPATQRPAEQPRPQTPASPPARQPSAATRTAGDTGGEMTRPQFIAAAAELGLNPRQAMDRLGVRSLEGLNLREALESLRRQLLGAASPSEPEPESEPESEPAPDSSVAEPSMPARYFEEEDDETILYALDEDEDELIEGDFAPSAGSDIAAPSAADDDVLDDLDLEDVPDLTPPPPARQRSAPATRKPANTVRETPAPAAEVAASGANRAQAMQLIGRMRAATGGGPASDYQRTAYRNIVENELGKAQATALVRGLWRTTVDRLSAGQLDALIRWGKEDVFADEAALVLGALRAEQRRTEQADTSTKGAGEGSAQRPAARGRSSGGSR